MKSEKLTDCREPLIECFLESLEEITSRYKGKRVLVLVLGSGALFTKALLKHPHAAKALSNALINDEGLIDLSILAETSKTLFREIFAADDVVVAPFESAIPIRGSLSELYDGEIIVVRNNLFGGQYPSAAEPKYLEELAKAIDDEGHENQIADIASMFYSSAVKHEKSFLVTSSLGLSDLNCTCVDLFPRGSVAISAGLANESKITAESPMFFRYMLSLCEGSAYPVSVEVDVPYETGAAYEGQAITVAAALLEKVGIPFAVCSRKKYDSRSSEESRLLPVLKRYWGPNAEFRPLSFYEDPEHSRSMIQLSQGYIADQVVTQAESALDDEASFRDIFITAPTGAGKSVLFQVPALYLAEEHNAVTLVVEPLIALMNDQVAGLRERGVSCVAAINSDLTYSERCIEIDRIKRGDVSLVYLSPELLLGSRLEDLIGDRPLGLLVVDEAHTVALWGKDFRSDYWFLGDYLSKLRQSGARFPTLCLTATAVLGGVDDVVYDVINELELNVPLKFIGNVRRNDLSFDIAVRDKRDYEGLINNVKTQLMVERIKEAVDSGKHTLVYCPYTSHVDAIVEEFDKTYPTMPTGTVMKYYGRLDSTYKGAVAKRFKSGQCRVVVCTTAFGMGVDVDDIEVVLHFAPTGNLSNYVQEIGRGARRKDLDAVARIDFFAQDARYFAQLYGMSALRHKQLKEVMKKLCSIYFNTAPRRQNMLIAPSSFSYLFGDGDDAINKTKSALMMIARDLSQNYGFPVLVVKSKPSYTKNYVCIPTSIDERFREKFGKYARVVCDAQKKNLAFSRRGRNSSAVVVRDIGSVYEINMAKMWEDCFSVHTFSQFKRMLFSGEIISSDNGDHPSSRLRLEIKYQHDFDQVCEKFKTYMSALQTTFVLLRPNGRFTVSQFKKKYEEILGAKPPVGEFPEKILDAFAIDPKGVFEKKPKSAIKCLQKKTEGNETKYRVAEKGYISIESKYVKRLYACRPTGDVFRVYLSREKATSEELDLAILLELFGLASYEARGGDAPEIFVRLNDPNKINALANDPRYRNRILSQLTARHELSRKMITRFFLTELSDSDRWDLIEAYFLGEDEWVSAALSIDDASADATQKKSRAKTGRDSAGYDLELCADGTDLSGMTFSQIWAYAKDDAGDEYERAVFDSLADLTASGSYEKPVSYPELAVPSTGERLTPTLAWMDAKVLLFLEEDAAMYAAAQESSWTSFLTGTEFEPEKLVEKIGR